MNLTYKHQWLNDLANSVPVNTRFSEQVISRYRERMQAIIDADDERDLRAVRGNNFEELKGLKGIYSMRLTKQFRVIFEIRTGANGNTIHITDITDYHK